MDYREYQTASQKHLNACKAILDSITMLNGNTSAQMGQSTKQQAVLHNIFYLSGYTLECIINYSILKHYKWKQSSVYVTDHSFSGKCDLAFYPETTNLKGRKYTYSLSQHEFSKNIQILRRDFSASKIPLIDKTESVNPDVLKLFIAWSVEIRYHKETKDYSGLVLNINNITLFVNTVDKIYNGLLNIVGL
jgi:hypothetical protein